MAIWRDKRNYRFIEPQTFYNKLLVNTYNCICIYMYSATETATDQCLSAATGAVVVTTIVVPTSHKVFKTTVQTVKVCNYRPIYVFLKQFWYRLRYVNTYTKRSTKYTINTINGRKHMHFSSQKNDRQIHRTMLSIVDFDFSIYIKISLRRSNP